MAVVHGSILDGVNCAMIVLTMHATCLSWHHLSVPMFASLRRVFVLAMAPTVKAAHDQAPMSVVLALPLLSLLGLLLWDGLCTVRRRLRPAAPVPVAAAAAAPAGSTSLSPTRGEWANWIAATCSVLMLRSLWIVCVSLESLWRTQRYFVNMWLWWQHFTAALMWVATASGAASWLTPFLYYYLQWDTFTLTYRAIEALTDGIGTMKDLQLIYSTAGTVIGVTSILKLLQRPRHIAPVALAAGVYAAALSIALSGSRRQLTTQICTSQYSQTAAMPCAEAEAMLRWIQTEAAWAAMACLASALVSLAAMKLVDGNHDD